MDSQEPKAKGLVMGQFERRPGKKNRRPGFPSFFCWLGDDILKQGNRWSLGWWTGRDGDLHLILPNIKDYNIEDLLLSPICRNRAKAILAFVIKRILVSVDENVRSQIEQANLKR